MTLYCGIDLHSNNHVICVINDQDERLLETRLANDCDCTLNALRPYKNQLKGVAIESTFNWYWLVDALTDNGFHVELVNTTKVVQYNGLKYSDDRYDAFHLAHLMRLGILPTGHIYPRPLRGLRDFLRKRMQLVQDRSRQIMLLKGKIHMHLGQNVSASQIKSCQYELPIAGDHNVQLACITSLAMVRAYSEQINHVETSIANQLHKDIRFRLLKSVPGIGDILAETIALETGNIKRFAKPGNYASYSRCVESRRESNGKKKGHNNRKNGNRYLAWAFMEAANFAIRYNTKAKAFYEKKCKTRNTMVARKALAHKLARACYWIMRNKEPFDESRAFA